MIRDNDMTWQFWRGCYCALDRDLHYAIEIKPTVKDNSFALLLVLNETNKANTHIIKDRKFTKIYTLDTHKIDIQKDWKIWTEKFMTDYFIAKENGCIK